MRVSLRARRIAAATVSVLLTCGVTTPQPAGAATPRSAPPVFREARSAAEGLTRLQLQIATRLAEYPSRVSSSGKNATGFGKVKSSSQLRRLAAKLRTSSPSTARHRHGLRLAAAAFPSLLNDPSVFTPQRTAALLEIAATLHDQRALSEAAERTVALAERREILPHAVLEPDLVPSRPAELLPRAPLTDLLKLYEIRRSGVVSTLVAAASTALELSENESAVSASALAGAWFTAGPRRTHALLAALSQVHDRYLFGSRGPTAFDCSGLTHYAWLSTGVKIRTSSTSQREQLRSIDITELQPGDLVFYGTPTDTSHVALSLGPDRLVIEANRGVGSVRIARYELRRAVAFGTPPMPEQRTDDLMLP